MKTLPISICYDEMSCFFGDQFYMWYISLVCFERTETLYKQLLQMYFFKSSMLQCGLDLQGKRMKRKRKLQAEDGEEDMAVGELSFIMVVWSSVNVAKSS